MNIIESISNYLKRGKPPANSEQNIQNKAKPQDKPREGNIKSAEPEPGFDFLDGMSTGTARFIIEREVDPAILEKYNIKATFFVLDLVAQKNPGIVKLISQKGHEIASHGT